MEPDGAGFRINDGQGGVAGVRECARRVEGGLRLEPVAQRLRQAVGLEVDDPGKLADRDGSPAVTPDPCRTIAQLDVGRARLEQAAGNLAQLVGDEVRGAGGGATADDDRAAGEGSPAIGDQVGVSLTQPDLVRVHTQPVGDDLRERRLVTLAMTAGTSGDDDLPRRVHPHLGRVVTRSHPHPPLRHGRRAVAGAFGEAGVTDSGPQPGVTQGVPLGVPAVVGHPPLGKIKGFAVAALVVGNAVDPGVGELAGADHDQPAQPQRVCVQRPGGLLHQPLHHQNDLRP